MANNKSKAVETPEVDVQDIVRPEPEKVETVKKAEPKVRKELPADLYVPCVSMIRTGKLVYVSKRQIGYTVVWQNFMDVQYVELKELMSMRASEVSFFQQNWIAIEDGFEYKDEVMEKLRVKEMYKDAPDPSDFDRLFVLPVEEMSRRVEGMSKALKDTVHSYAKECIASGSLDSLKRIRVLEKALGKSLS